MILLADHQDSFTRNLEHLLAGFDRVVVRDRRELTPELIEQCHLLVLSPGPASPRTILKPSIFFVPASAISPCLAFA